MSAYLPISDYGVIGDLHTAALVGRTGAVDWWCVPRFDSPAVFAAMLDARRGGRWQIAPAAPATATQRYLAGTNVLVTTFNLETRGVLVLTDFMPVGPSRRGRAAIYRKIEAYRGSVPVRVWFEPRFRYGAEPARLFRRRAGLLAADDHEVLALSAPAGLGWTLENGAAEARLELADGDAAWLVLRYDDDEVPALDALDPETTQDETARWWDGWLSQLRYQGPYRQEVERSALALKLLQYEPSGAIVASPTTSLPEWPGGERNWDYRYTWLRDSSFVLYSLDALGFTTEAESYLGFFKRVCRQSDARHLQILHTVDGRRDVPEIELKHLEGYGGSRPVRIGNGAIHQFQLDIYGALLETLSIGHRNRTPSEGVWVAARRLVDWVAAHWQEPDFGLWEARQAPRHHVFSKVMAWRALDRGSWLAERYGLEGEVETWRRAAAAVHAEVLERGWDSTRRCFVQAYDEPYLDASLLVIPKVRFLPRSDPRVRSTLEAIRRELSAGPEELIYRYRAPDGLRGDEGAFIICSQWMVQNLAMVGEPAEAERLFRLQLRRGGTLGLFAEEVDPRTGEALGNYPLGLSHAGVLNTAVILEKLRAKGADRGTEGRTDRGTDGPRDRRADELAARRTDGQ